MFVMCNVSVGFFPIAMQNNQMVLFFFFYGMVIFWRTRLGPKFGRLWQKNLSHARSLAAPVIADVKATAEQCQEQCTDPGRREQGRLFFSGGLLGCLKIRHPHLHRIIYRIKHTNTHNYTQFLGSTWYAKFLDKPMASYFWNGSTVQQPELPSASPFLFGPGGPKAGVVCKQE